jgi:translation elongation factor EF-1alpha
VKEIELARGRNEPVARKVVEATPRDVVSVNIDAKYGVVRQLLDGGGMLTGEKDTLAVAKVIEAEIHVVSKPTGAYTGWDPYLLFHVMGTAGKIVSISETRWMNEEWEPFADSFVREGQQARVVIQLRRGMPLETQAGNARLSRFTMRDHSNISGMGFCTSVIEAY